VNKHGDSRVKGAGRASLFLNVLGYAVATVACLAVMAGLMRVWDMDISEPFTYGSDAAYYTLVVRGTMENGWYQHNDRVGAPFGLDLYDFPQGDTLHVALVRLIALAVHRPFAVANLYYLLTFPLTTLASLIAMRRFGISYAVALASSLLYTFLPFHLFRNVQLFIAGYFLVPFMVMVVLWVYREPLRWRSLRFLASVSICALMALGGIYYAFFGCFFLGVAGLRAALERKSWAALITAALLIGVIVGAGLVNTAPTFLFRYAHGANPEGLKRSPAGGEIYGLKIGQLLLPVTGHRIGALATAKDLYNKKMPLVNENDHATLGALGAFGFLGLIGCLFVRRWPQDRPSLPETLSVLNLFAVLLAVTGGFAGVVALALPEIRSFNRMSVYIGFFALFALALAMDRLVRRMALGSWRQPLLGVGLTAVVAVGLLDQIPFKNPMRPEPAESRQDANFVQRIEAALPKGSMVFQLPYVPFPENPPVQRMEDYDHLKGYLHSDSLRWSYPTMRGRPGDAWNREIAGQPVQEMLKSLTEAGFAGLYIDRYGFADGAAELAGRLSALLPGPPFDSENGRLRFYSLTDYAHRQEVASRNVATQPQ
jgi:phosphoglycerol transferase